MKKTINIYLIRRISSKNQKPYLAITDDSGRFISIDLKVILRYFTFEEIAELEKKEVKN